MIQIKGKIPITIYPTFWLFAALIGFFSSMGSNVSAKHLVIGTVFWVGIILISVLFHELGHALTSLWFGQKPKIELVALGGLTYHEGEKLSKGKQFFIVLNGPLFGFILFLAAAFFHQAWHLTGYVGHALSILVWVNLFWTVINLIPILPLDGGQLMRIALEGIWGVQGTRYALLISAILAFLVSFASFLTHYFLLGALLFLFGYQSFEVWRRTRHIKAIDQEEAIKSELAQAEALIAASDFEGAAHALQAIREKTKEGMLFNIATQELAYLHFKKEKVKEAYFLLKPIKADLSDEFLVVLHNSAAMVGDYELVDELSGAIFQVAPSVDNAIRNAVAAAAKKNIEAVIGWLSTAKENGCHDLSFILSDPAFDNVRESASFQSFLKHQKES